MRPFKVTFYMMTPISLSHPWMHFDSLLKHLKGRDELGEDYYVLPSKEPLEFESDIPLKKFIRGGKYVYHASISFFDSNVISTATIYKKFYEKEVSVLNVKKVDLARGLYKMYAMKLPYIPAKTVTFYGCGEVEEVVRLLKHLDGLGKKVAIGFGAFRKFTIEEINEDMSLVCSGIAMRPIPIDMLEYASEVMMLAYKSPYWDKRNVTLCAPPGAEVRFK